MKDIRSLFEAAKSSGRSNDVSAYVEAVDQLLESNPRDFLSNVEYIISSGYGAQKFPAFVERYGLPIVAYEPVMEKLDHLIEFGQATGKRVEDQIVLKEYLEAHCATYPSCFMMYESFMGKDAAPGYLDAFYQMTEDGHQGSKLLTKMYGSFKEAAIPDLLITARHLGESAVDTTFIFLMEQVGTDATMNQWLLEASKDVIYDGHVAPYMGKITERSLQNIVSRCQQKNQSIYRESKLMGNDDAMYEYYPHELKAIEDLISFREYQMLFLTGDAQMKCFQEVMSLYEELDGLIPEDATCFNEATNPKNQTLKEIADRLNKLAKQAAKYVRAEVDDGSILVKNGQPYSIVAGYGSRRGPGTGFGGLRSLIKKNMSDISDFSDEWMENIFLYIQFHVNSSSIKNDMSKIRSAVYRALKPLIDDEKIKTFQSLNSTAEYSCWIAFKVGKTYAVGDSDIGMFESVAAIEEHVADQLIPMMALPNGQVIESKVLMNTRNKKTGQAPGYLSDNHDLGWGEQESDTKKPRAAADDDDETEHTLDDFKRPSAMASEEPSGGDEDDSSTPATPADDQRAVNNYYYYTYNNSMNKNSNSFNKTQKDDHSISDDHSVRTRSDDHSITSKKDDHSTGKGSVPDDVDGGKPADKPGPDYTDPDEEYKSYGEATSFRDTKAWEKECRSFDKLFKVDLNKLGDVNSPAKEIPITIGQKKMTFRSALGNIPGREEKLSNYAQVPTAVHQFNVHKARITQDKIGIDRCILHYLKLRDRDFDSDMSIDAAIKKYNVKAKNIVFNLYGEIGLTFTSSLDDGKTFAVLIDDELNCKDGDKDILLTEAVGDADDMKPKSDHPIKDTFQDIDRETTKVQQKAKKKVQDTVNVGRAVMKPVNRTKQWLTKMVIDWKDKDENAMKEKLADPHARNNLFHAIKSCIKYGALAKAGLLFNPIFLGLSLFNVKNKKSKEFRIRNEMIGELKTEIAIIDEKIKDADSKGDNKAKYQLMRLKNEINKKLLRVGGTKEFKKII